MWRRVRYLLTVLVPLSLISSLYLYTLGPGGTADGVRYFWASGRGNVGQYSTSRFQSRIRNLTASLSWTWHGKKLRYANIPNSVSIDDKMCIYLTSVDGVRKFSPNGKQYWRYMRRNRTEELPDASALYRGALYGATTAGRVFALDMERGTELWSTYLSSNDFNNGWVNVHEEVVIVGSNRSEDINGQKGCCGAANHLVNGLDAKTGSVLWTYRPEAPVWNFLASFAGDGTFIFQDLEGRAYRNNLRTGLNLWKAGGAKGSWTDGSALLGSNGVVYAVNTFAMGSRGPDGKGAVSAYRLEDGGLIWSFTTPRPPNNVPAVGPIVGHLGLSLVQPIGQQCEQGNPTDVYALDAETGHLRWVFEGPSQSQGLQASDINPEVRAHRAIAGVRQLTLTNPWGAPSIDADGTVVVGNQDGLLFALRDEDGDGKVFGQREVDSFNTNATFSGSSSPAFAPGMMVVASVDAMYVFKGEDYATAL